MDDTGRSMRRRVRQAGRPVLRCMRRAGQGRDARPHPRVRRPALPVRRRPAEAGRRARPPAAAGRRRQQRQVGNEGHAVVPAVVAEQLAQLLGQRGTLAGARGFGGCRIVRLLDPVSIDRARLAGLAQCRDEIVEQRREVEHDVGAQQRLDQVVRLGVRLEFTPRGFDRAEQDFGTERVGVGARHAAPEQHAEAYGQRGERLGVGDLERPRPRDQRQTVVDVFEGHEAERPRRRARAGRRQRGQLAAHGMVDRVRGHVHEGICILLQQPGRLDAPVDVARVQVVAALVGQRPGHPRSHRAQVAFRMIANDTGERIQRRLLRRCGLACGRSLDMAG